MCDLLLWICLCLPGFASAQKVIQLSYCSIEENHVRLDCKYSLPAESPQVFCKYTQGERLLDTTNPEEEQHAPYKHRAKARIFPGNICRLLFKNLPNGKSNFTCNIKLADSASASKTSVVEKSKLPRLWTSRLNYCEWRPLKTLLRSYCRASPPLFCLECPVTKLQWPAVDLDDTSHAARSSLAVNMAPKLLHLIIWWLSVDSQGCVLSWMRTRFPAYLGLMCKSTTAFTVSSAEFKHDLRNIDVKCDIFCSIATWMDHYSDSVLYNEWFVAKEWQNQLSPTGWWKTSAHFCQIIINPII